MSETASTVRLNDSGGGADSVVARSANKLLFAIIPYRPTTYLLCSLCFIFILCRNSKDPAHGPITYYSLTSLISVKMLFVQGYTIFVVDNNLQWYHCRLGLQVSYGLHLNFVNCL